MKIYKKIMNALAKFEEYALVVVMVVVTVLTAYNVFSRYVIHSSLSFTEELVIALFVLMTMLGAALCAREGSLVSLTLVYDRLSDKWKKIFTVIVIAVSLFFCFVLVKYGFSKVFTQMKNGSETFSLRWPEWVFTIYLPIGGIFMIIHFIENLIDNLVGKKAIPESKEGLDK